MVGVIAGRRAVRNRGRLRETHDVNGFRNREGAQRVREHYDTSARHEIEGERVARTITADAVCRYISVDVGPGVDRVERFSQGHDAVNGYDVGSRRDENRRAVRRSGEKETKCQNKRPDLQRVAHRILPCCNC